MITITTWFNERCLKCGNVFGAMIKIGNFVMCDKCFTSEFDHLEPIEEGTKRGDKYFYWLHIGYKSIGNINDNPNQ